MPFFERSAAAPTAQRGAACRARIEEFEETQNSAPRGAGMPMTAGVDCYAERSAVAAPATLAQLWRKFLVPADSMACAKALSELSMRATATANVQRPSGRQSDWKKRPFNYER